MDYQTTSTSPTPRENNARIVRLERRIGEQEEEIMRLRHLLDLHHHRFTSIFMELLDQFKEFKAEFSNNQNIEHEQESHH